MPDSQTTVIFSSQDLVFSASPLPVGSSSRVSDLSFGGPGIGKCLPGASHEIFKGTSNIVELYYKNCNVLIL